MTKASEEKILKAFHKLKKDIDTHTSKHGNGIWDKIADKAVDKGFDLLSSKLGMGIHQGLVGRGFDDATVRPIIHEIGSWLSPATAVELFGGGIWDKLNPLALGYDLGHDVIAPQLMKVIPPPKGGNLKSTIKDSKLEPAIHIDIGSHNADKKSKTGDGLKKGSEKAKAWGQRMKELREAKKKMK